MLGHKSATMTLDLYGHVFDDRLNEVADALDRAVRDLPVSKTCTGGQVVDLDAHRRRASGQQTWDPRGVHLIEQLSLFAKQGELLTKVPTHLNRNRTRVRQVINQQNRKLTPDELTELVKLYQSGLDLTALGRHFGMHRQTARSLLLKRGMGLSR